MLSLDTRGLEKADQIELAKAFDKSGLARIRWIVIECDNVVLSVNTHWARRITGVPLSIEVAAGFSQGLFNFQKVTPDSLYLDITPSASPELGRRPDLLFGLYAPVECDEGGFVAGVMVHPLSGALRPN
jgi:hypothetical protein